MIISRTPLRISFIGGGSDIADYYRKSPGAVISSTINKYMYISSHNFFDTDKIRAKYSKTETVSDPGEIKHPIISEVLKMLSIKGGLEISSLSDIPACSGMGSSSAFTICLIHNLFSRFKYSYNKETLASKSCYIEIDRLKENIGKQDQYICSYGGFNVINFLPDNTVKIDPLQLEADVISSFESNLFLFYIGNERSASEILKEQIKSMGDTNKFEIIKQMVLLVNEFVNALKKGNLYLAGQIIHENWMLKRKITSLISNDYIDNIYNDAINAGAVGGKLLGAGSGGFLLFYCEKKNHKSLKNALKKLRQVNFKFEYEGSRIIYKGDEDE